MLKAIKLNPRVVINLTETGQTLGYMGRYEEALAISEQAYKVESGNFWAKTSLAYMVLTTHGDTDRALSLVVGAQHTNDPSNLLAYWSIQMLAGQFEAALEFARTWTREWEIGFLYIQFRESYIAQTLFAMGRDDEAKAKSLETLGLLDELKQQGIDDFRVALQAVTAYGILGDKQKVTEMADRLLSTKPADAVEDFKFRLIIAKAYAFAGMNAESIETLDLLLSGKSDISVPWIDIDPAFNRMRNEPEFMALLERYR
jgi:tetratricopeptide (TPR) repeat protein